jgi:hypothetical protein
MIEKPDKKEDYLEPHSPTAEELETEKEILALLESGGEIIAYNRWLPEQCFLTEIKVGDKTHSFKTSMPISKIIPPAEPKKEEGG